MRGEPFLERLSLPDHLNGPPPGGAPGTAVQPVSDEGGRDRPFATLLRSIGLRCGQLAVPWKDIAFGIGVAVGVLAVTVGAFLWWLGSPPPGPVPSAGRIDRRPATLVVPDLPGPVPLVATPRLLDVPKPPVPALPRAKATPVDPPGIENARSLMGRWCGGGMALTLGPAEWTSRLPSGAVTPMQVGRYGMSNGVLSVELTFANGRRGVWEFGEFAAGRNVMVQLRGRTDPDPDWREYNREFRRC